MQHQTQRAVERHRLADAVVELDLRQDAADGRARIRTRRRACKRKPTPCHSTPWNSPTDGTLTFGHGAGPLAVLLAGRHRLAVHHEAVVAVELDHIAGLVETAALNVAVLRTGRRVARHLCAHRRSRPVFTCCYWFKIFFFWGGGFISLFTCPVSLTFFQKVLLIFKPAIPN